MIFSFPAISDNNSKILILGTMPGVESLRAAEYYAHPRNAFWRILFAMADETFCDDYLVKKNLLLQNHIALWDVLQACERKGSLDSDIKDDVPNNINQLLIDHPEIDTIFFNGQHAAKLYKKYFPEISLAQYILPSTSPAHAVPLSRKASEWMIIMDVLRK